MGKWIDADAVCELLEPFTDAFDDMEVTSAYVQTLILISNAPSIDIEPKRGEWIDKGWKGDWQFETDGRGNCWHEYECSECGFCNKGSKSNFCPNCGARMKGAETEG